MLSALTLAALFSYPMLVMGPEGTGDTNSGGGRGTPPVVLVKSAGVRAVQEVADAFSDGCRVHVQQIYVGEGPSENARAREIFYSARVLVAVGQPAIDLMGGVRAKIVYALAPDPPPGSIGTNNSASPYQVFRQLLQLLPKTRRIAAISSERGAHRMAQAKAAARSLNVELVDLAAADSAAAIRALRALFIPMPEDQGNTVAGSPVDALWLGADPQLIDTHVLQFAVQMQIEWRVPVIAATRQQVAFGALMAVDWPLEAVGKHLAWQVNQILADPDHIEPVSPDHPGGLPETVINGHAAWRLGLPVKSLRTTSGYKVIDR